MNHRGPAASRHVPVLVDRVVELLAPALSRAGAVHVDGTLGMGGHAQAVLDTFPEAVVVGVDRDTEALALPPLPQDPGPLSRRLASYGVTGITDATPGQNAADLAELAAYTNSTREIAALPTRRTRPWTCGWTKAAARQPLRSSRPTPRQTSRAFCGSTARSASLAGSLGPSSPGALRRP